MGSPESNNSKIMTNIDIKESEPTTDLQIPSKDSNTIITERQRPEITVTEEPPSLDQPEEKSTEHGKEQMKDNMEEDIKDDTNEPEPKPEDKEETKEEEDLSKKLKPKKQVKFDEDSLKE